MAWDFSTEPEIRGAARVDARLRARGDLADRGHPARASARRSSNGSTRRSSGRSGSAGCGRRTCRRSSAARASARCKLGLMNEILGTSIFAPNAFGCQAPDSGNSEIIALAGTDEQKERWLYPLLDGELKSAFSMTEPETRRARTRRSCGRARCGSRTAATSSAATSGSPRTARSPTSSIVMAVTDPDARSRTSARRCSSSPSTRPA